jgi:hypothetical protein
MERATFRGVDQPAARLVYSICSPRIIELNSSERCRSRSLAPVRSGHFRFLTLFSFSFPARKGQATAQPAVENISAWGVERSVRLLGRIRRGAGGPEPAFGQGERKASSYCRTTSRSFIMC